MKTKGIAIRVASPKLVMEEAPESYKDVTQASVPSRAAFCLAARALTALPLFWTGRRHLPRGWHFEEDGEAAPYRRHQGLTDARVDGRSGARCGHRGMRIIHLPISLLTGSLRIHAVLCASSVAACSVAALARCVCFTRNRRHAGRSVADNVAAQPLAAARTSLGCTHTRLHSACSKTSSASTLSWAAIECI